MWLAHLESVHQHRNAGAKKAAETCRKKHAEKDKSKERKKAEKLEQGHTKEDKTESHSGEMSRKYLTS